MADRLRFRVYVGERDSDELRLIDEATVGDGGPGAPPEIVAHWQGTICRDAQIAGMRWRLEVADPDDPDDPPLWFGSDSAGMVMPVVLTHLPPFSPN